VCNHTHISLAEVIFKDPATHSGHELLEKVKDGFCLSILITTDVFILSQFQNKSTLRYLTYCAGQVLPTAQVTFADVHVMFGVHPVGVVVIQYKV